MRRFFQTYIISAQIQGWIRNFEGYKYFLKNLIKKKIGEQDQCFIERNAQMLLLEDLTGVHTVIP